MDEKNTWGIVQERIDEMKDLTDRQGDTEHLLQWDDSPYELVKPDGKTKLKDAISVTPNLPKVFAHGIVQDLIGGKWQTVVEGEISGTASHLVETFVDDGFAQADELLLAEHGIPSLMEWQCNHVCVRWAIGTRCTTQVVDGEYRLELLPVDMRWTPFVLGKWVAPISFRSKSDTEEDIEKYRKFAENGVGEYSDFKPGKENEVRDFWDKEKNEWWVNGQLVFTQKNPFTYPPFVIVVPSAGFMLRGKDYLKHEGEDILFLNAGLYKELARSISLEQTSGYAGLYPAYEYETNNIDGKPSDPLPKLDETLKRRTGELHKPVPRGDINRAGQTAREDIQVMINTGAPLSPKEYNTPPSAVLLAGETELISRLQNSRKSALGLSRTQLARMMIDQFNQIKPGEVKIGKKGKRSTYSALVSTDDFSISYHLLVKNKRQELANLAEFTAAYDKLPLKWNLTNILMADDPAGIINDWEIQKAKDMNPAISLLEQAVRYAREAKDMEDENEADLMKEQSKILTHEYVMAMKQRTQPQIEPPKGNSQLLNQMGGAEGALRGETTVQREG